MLGKIIVFFKILPHFHSGGGDIYDGVSTAYIAPFNASIKDPRQTPSYMIASLPLISKYSSDLIQTAL